jgi:hypothetical protein
MTWASQLEIPLRRGIPIGYETSDILATLFLLDIDDEINKRDQMVRYVDDMYIFCANERQARHSLAQLDLLMQKRGLVLQTSKIAFENIDDTLDETRRFKEELRGKLSLIQLDLQGPPEHRGQAQVKLHDLFFSIWDSSDEDACIKTYDTELMRIFYRLKIPDERIKAFALRLLDKLPHRSFFLTTYLSLFRADRQVIEKLLSLINDPREHEEIRANCLRAAELIVGDSSDIVAIARQWCQEQSWYLRLLGVDILQNHNEEHEFLINLALVEKNTNVLASILTACFFLSEEQENRNEVIRQAFSSEDEYINSLGMYLYKRDINLLWKDVKVPTKPFLGKLLKGITEPRTTYQDYSDQIQTLLGFQISNNLPLDLIFPETLSLVHQSLLDARDAVPTSDFVRATATLARCFIQAVFQTDYSDVASITLSEVLPVVNDHITIEHLSYLGQLEFIALQKSTNTASVLNKASPDFISLSIKERLLEQISVAFARLLLKLHEQWAEPVPNTLQETANRNRSMEPTISSTQQSESEIRILLLAANPKDTDRIRLDEEIREIKQTIRKASQRDRIKIETEVAVRYSDLQNHLVTHKPAIVHFSGHGSSSGEIVLEDDGGSAMSMSIKAIKNLFGILRQDGIGVKCVVLNACWSEHQAKALQDVVDCVVGMAASMNDDSAIQFANGFYIGIAEGRSIQGAFDLGRNRIEIYRLDNVHTPQLICRHGIDPRKYKI